uniref:hypothetical protein n=1 Tax=Pseudomonas viridiflava TaxID=33069 RepID=UPI0013CF3B6D
PNLTVISSLTGVSLSSDSVDGALRLTLPGAAGQRLIAWDGLMTQTLTDYDLLLCQFVTGLDGTHGRH